MTQSKSRIKNSKLFYMCHGVFWNPLLKGLFVRECAEGSRCSRKTLCVCVGGGGGGKCTCFW